MLTILVGTVDPGHEVDIDAADTWGKQLPKEMTESFRQVLPIPEDSYVAIRVYTDTLINYIGELIYEGTVQCADVKLITEHGVHYFNSQGVIDTSWPHGIFNYS